MEVGKAWSNLSPGIQNGDVKRDRVLAHLKKLKANLIFFQETHLRNKDNGYLHRGWVGQVYHSSFQAGSRGAAMLISKAISFICSKSFSDRQGRYIVVEEKFYNVPLTLVCVYALNYDDDQFFSSLWYLIPNLNSQGLIIGEDFNCVLDPKLDRSSQTSQPLSRSARNIEWFLKDYGTVNPWWLKNPSSCCYSFFSPVHQSYSWIDYFLVDCKLLSYVK